MWWTIGLGVIVFYLLYQQGENIKNLVQGRGYGHSDSFNLNALIAVMRHPQFSELSGIESANKSTKVNEWSKADQAKWSALRKKLSTQTGVHVDYFISEDTFFVRSGDQSYFSKRRHNNNLLYNQVVLGDEDGFDPRLELSIYERVIKEGARYNRVITPCLEYHKEALGKKDFSILFDFPYQKTDGDDAYYKSLGFEVDKSGGDDVFTNSFGDMESIPTMLKFKKNGAEISFMYF